MPSHDEPAELDLATFLQLLPRLDAADLMAVSAAYQEIDATARAEARSAAAVVARRNGVRDELGRIHGSIIQWAGSNVSPSSAFTLEGLQTNPMLGDIRVEAIPPLLDAATALLLEDALTEEQRSALLDPLSAAIG